VTSANPEPLPSWNDTAARQAIMQFVKAVSGADRKGHVPPEERVAVFDNDGTLWCEQPMPIQADFILRRLAAMADQDPSLRDRQPWKAAYEQDYGWLGGVITRHYHGDDRELPVLAAGVLQALPALPWRTSRPKPTRSCAAPSIPPWAAATWPAPMRPWWSC
jgi:hypothetical protein